MPWLTPKSKPLASPTSLSDFQPVEVLYDFEGPRTFICVGEGNRLFLAHQCDEDNGVFQFIVVETTRARIELLKQGRLSLRAGLDAPEMWLVDLNSEWAPIAVYPIRFHEIPPEYLPTPAAFLDRPNAALAASARSEDR